MSSKNKILTWLVSIIAVLAGGIGAFLWYQNDNNPSKQHIPVAMALDDGYLYPTVVSITSAAKNKSKNVVYDYYIMHPAEFSEKSKTTLESLGKKYKDCNINLIDMGEAYKSANDKGHITTPAYYRLSLSDLLPDLDKILWIDGDTLILGDLTPMYATDMEGYYYKGLLDETVDAAEAFGVHNDHCICSGVMVVNLAELRKDDMVNKFQKFIEENNDRLTQHDQTVINVMCVDKMGKIDPRYGIFNYYCDTKSMMKYYNTLISKDKYTMEELLEARDNPVLVHCVMKPWKNYKTKYFDEWWDYAKKTDCYNEIMEKFGSVFEQ